MEKRLLPTIPEKIGKTVEKYMKLDGINLMTGSRVEKIDQDSVYVNGEKIQAEKVLLCIGRKANINSDELKSIGIAHDDKCITVNEKMQTSIPNIYAIGDVTGKFELAHVAAKQGEVAADNIMGKNSTVDYSAIPMCVFTFPEVAFVGNCEGEGKSFPLIASAKATCLSETRGFIDVFEENGTISGVIIVGPHAGEVLGEATLAVKQKMKCSEIIDTIHAHPTLSEAFVDATRMTEEKSIHI
jgi:dihydrolipoamide dehydrogenase